MTDLPVPIWSGSFWLGDVEMKCHVLSNGKRIIEIESINHFFDGAHHNPTEEQLQNFAKWQKGIS